MKTFLKITALAAITVALLGPARLFASQPAGPAQTYHGTITGGTFYCDAKSGFRPIVTGKWNVNIDPATPAQVTLNVFYNGRHALGVRVQQVDARLVRRRRLYILGVRRFRDGDDSIRS